MKSKHILAGHVLHLPHPSIPKWVFKPIYKGWLPLNNSPLDGLIVSVFGRWYLIDTRIKKEMGAG